MNDQFMAEAIRLSRIKMRANCGGPFGAVIVRRGKIIARGWNQVTSANDPTAHAEVMAIRAACRKLGTFELTGCELYASCEPCPMCLAAIYWARLDKVYFGATRRDAARIDFDDALIYREIAKPVSRRRTEARKVFTEWAQKTDKTPY